VTHKDYSIMWLILGSSSRLQCEVAKYSYAFGDPKYRSASMIVAPWYLWWKAFECWRHVFVCFSSCVLWPWKQPSEYCGW